MNSVAGSNLDNFDLDELNSEFILSPPSDPEAQSGSPGNNSQICDSRQFDDTEFFLTDIIVLTETINKGKPESMGVTISRQNVSNWQSHPYSLTCSGCLIIGCKLYP